MQGDDPLHGSRCLKEHSPKCHLGGERVWEVSRVRGRCQGDRSEFESLFIA